LEFAGGELEPAAPTTELQVYRGKVIFYSIGNFASDNSSPRLVRDINMDYIQKLAKVKGLPYTEAQSDGSFKYPMDDQRKTMIAKWLISGGQTERVSFVLR
jgi:hypothetical protein